MMQFIVWASEMPSAMLLSWSVLEINFEDFGARKFEWVKTTPSSFVDMQKENLQNVAVGIVTVKSHNL